MLFAVEGGEFFSSSASGYSKGLSLLLLGQKSDDKHVRITPWSRYELVNQETDSDLQLASRKNRLSHWCTSFVCFGRASAGLDGQSPLKVRPSQSTGIVRDSPTIEGDKQLSNTTTDYDISGRDISLKSSLKKPSYNGSQTNKKNDENEPQPESDGADHPEVRKRRKVQWTDACGKELAEIREFELSEIGDWDDEFANGNGKTCSCSIM